MHLHDTANTFLLAAHRVIHAVAFFQHAGINTDKRQLADIRVSHQFECQRRKLLVVIRVTENVVTVFVCARHRWNIQRRRHQFDHGIEHTLHAFILERTAAQHRLDFTGDSAQTQTFGNFILSQRAFFEIFIHQRVISFGGCRHHFLAPFFCQSLQFCRDRFIGKGHTLCRVIP
ncbi:hypothetical protein SRABI106_04339 [Rahnella aquatilis]|nr:hypothetical protein SRABI106_04339 [Rahnella aquatilis]